MKTWKRKCLIGCVLLIAGALGILFYSSRSNVIEINIGYQSITSQTWGALIVKNQKLLEKKISEKYDDAKVSIIWHDELSGASINNNMLAHKYQFGYMGDMPCIINLYNSYSNLNYSSYLLALDGKGINGLNQAIVVNNNSGIENAFQLAGKKISVPVGSSAHRMLIEILEKYELTEKVTIVHQDIPTACSMLEAGKVDAIVVWEPYETYLSTLQNAHVLVSGEETGTTYLAGVMVDQEFAKRYPEIVNIFKQCIEETHELMKKNPKECALSISEESGFDVEVVNTVINKIKWESELLEEDAETLNADYLFLLEKEVIGEYPFVEELQKRRNVE